MFHFHPSDDTYEALYLWIFFLFAQSVFTGRPTNFHWQACALKLVGLQNSPLLQVLLGGVIWEGQKVC